MLFVPGDAVLMAKSPTTVGQLRQFQADAFDAHLHMTYLLSMEQSGVQEYLVNELYKTKEEDVDFYLPQLCHLSLQRYRTSSLYRFLLDKAAGSMYFALKIHWLLQSILEDCAPELKDSAMEMVNASETVLVNSSALHRNESPFGIASDVPDTPDLPPTVGEKGTVTTTLEGIDEAPQLGKPFDEEQVAEGVAVSSEAHVSAVKHFALLSRSCTSEHRAHAVGLSSSLPNAFVELGTPIKGWLDVKGDENNASVHLDLQKFMWKQRRCEYFNTQNHFVAMITKLSSTLVSTTDKIERHALLCGTLQLVNQWLFERRTVLCLTDEVPTSLLGLHVPMLLKRNTRVQILRVHIEQCRIFSSATRAPFLIVFESVDLEDELSGEDAGVVAPAETRPNVPAQLLPDCVGRELSEACGAAGQETFTEFTPKGISAQLLKIQPQDWCKVTTVTSPPAVPSPLLVSLCPRCPHSVSPREVEDLVEARAGQAVLPGCGNLGVSVQGNEAAVHSVPPGCEQCPAFKRNEQAVTTRASIWGEPWGAKKERLRKASPFSRYSSWELTAAVVKGGDDVRQELLASQVIQQFSQVFKEANLPLWLKENEVLVVSSTSGFIECIQDAISVDSIKKGFPGKTLADIFKVAFADRLFEAKRNFIESCAAYALVTWFLQVKDRHNGNLMMDSSGHVVHIDFGFMLSNSPGGNMAFERSPFKLTREFLDVMDGECSDQYEYFRTLVIRGFLEARRHMERIALPIKMLLSGSRLACFREGAECVLEGLADRFFIRLSEEACIEKIVDLIDTSANNWRTIQYDNYQRIVHGIH